METRELSREIGIRRRTTGTRTNTGHAVLMSTSIPPKMKRIYGQDGRTDRPTQRSLFALENNRKVKREEGR